MRAEPKTMRAKPTSMRAEPKTMRAKPTSMRAEPKAMRAEPTSMRAEPQTMRAEPKTTRAEPQKSRRPCAQSRGKCAHVHARSDVRRADVYARRATDDAHGRCWRITAPLWSPTRQTAPLYARPVRPQLCLLWARKSPNNAPLLSPESSGSSARTGSGDVFELLDSRKRASGVPALTPNDRSSPSCAHAALPGHGL